MTRRSAWTWFAPIAAASFLAACGGSSSGTGPRPDPGPDPGGNTAPQISGSPPTVAEPGQPYSFQPEARDTNGDSLTFNIQNKPAWATFDSASGRLYGTPACTGGGTIANIVISVSDGRATSALPGFSITVASTPSVTVSWVAPATNEDGSPVGELDGFGVYFGTASRQYSQFIGIPDSNVTSACIGGLSTGTTWYFAVTAISRAGVESTYSREASALPR